MQTFGIGANQILEILAELGAIDSKSLNAAAVGLEMIKCTTANPDDNRTMVNNNKCKCDARVLTISLALPVRVHGVCSQMRRVQIFRREGE